METRDVLDLAREIEAEPGLRGVLEDAVRQHEIHGREPYWGGFGAAEVHASHWQMRRLNQLRVVDEGYRSNKRTEWKLADVDAVRQALKLASAQASVRPEATEPPADLFDVVEGHQVIKEVLWAAIRAARPVHVLLLGPPASAKSLFLAELERLPGARRALGGTTTNAGLVGFLLQEPGCRYLLIDELDKREGRELVTLYGLMAEGRVERLQHGHQEQEQRDVRVVATANTAGNLSDALRSRFTLLRFQPYTPEEFYRVALKVLVRREGCDPELAAEIATAVTPRTRDPRQAVYICRLCDGDRRRVAGLVKEVLG